MTYPIIIESAGGEYMETVLVVEWAAGIGDPVKAGDVVVTVETAKAATEIEAAHDGYLTEILFKVGSEAPVGSVLGIISDTSAATGPASAQVPAAPAAVASGNAAPASPPPVRDGGRIVASPLARRLARAAGIDLSGIRGSGPNGRIKRRDVEAAVPAASKDAPVPAPAVVSGAETPIVLLHGFGADRSAWRWVTPLLGRDRPVFALDLPGHGGAGETQVRGIEDMALAVSDGLDAMGIESAHLVGHSLGGAAALALTRLGRLQVRSLCLIAPAGLGAEINGAFLNGLAGATRPESLEPWLKVMVGDPASLPDGFARAVLRQREKAGDRQAGEMLANLLFPDGTQAFDLHAALVAVGVPARVIWGRRDAIIPFAHALTAPGTVGLHLLEGIGHVPPMECPAIVARLIVELVKSAE